MSTDSHDGWFAMAGGTLNRERPLGIVRCLCHYFFTAG